MSHYRINTLKKVMTLATFAIVMVAAGCTKNDSQANAAAELQRDWNARIEELLARSPKDATWRGDAKTAITQLGELGGGATEWSQTGVVRLEDALMASLEDEVAAMELQKENLESERKKLSSQLLGIQAEIMDCARESQDLTVQVQVTEAFKERVHAMEAIHTLLASFTGQNPGPNPEVEAVILKYTTEHLESSQGIDRHLAEVGGKLAGMVGPWQETLVQLESCKKMLFDLQLELIGLQRAREKQARAE